MNIDLPPQYDPKSVEAATYQSWLASGAFHATPDAPGTPARPHFSIVIPPPNVTGALHLGHAINGTIQDILTRYHRMKGDNTLWMPGIDHAGIATQAVVERTIFEKEGKNRHDLGREELVRRIWEWKQQYGDRIISQQQSLGASCDWARTRFTLDDICAKAVREAFFKMFEDGLIFRGKRLVNWDTHLQTAVADDEIYRETVRGQMTSIKYPIEGLGVKGEGLEYLIAATTRPETMLGDTAVAVHPDDPRYKHLIGKHVIVPLVGRKIPIIADGLLVDPAFGTGVVKVTPAHDPNDYATGQRHNLEQINLLTPDGRVNENGAGTFNGTAHSYIGLKFASEARKRVLADLEALDLIAEAKPHEHEVGHSDRSKTPIEPYLSDQWFVRMGDIAQSEPSHAEPRPLGSGPSDQQAPPLAAQSNSPPHSLASAYFITFHTYSTWVRGNAQGAVDDEHNEYHGPFVPPDPELLARELANASHPPFILSISQRQSIVKTIQEVAAHRAWTLHAVNVRSTHVHIVVSGGHSPERMMNDFKSYATRRMTESGFIARETKVWSRHGSTRYLWKHDDANSAITYTLKEQGDNPAGTAVSRSEPADSQPTEPRPSGSGFSAPPQPLPNGRGSAGGSAGGSDGITLADGTKKSGLAQAAMDAVTDGRVKITPDRYAKGYLDWLGQKRDWCISRQLWWGHRIPVWSKSMQLSTIFVPNAGNRYEKLLFISRAGGQAVISVSDPATGQIWHNINNKSDRAKNEWDNLKAVLACGDREVIMRLCIVDRGNPVDNGDELTESMKSASHAKWCIRHAEDAGFIQDPDVLDTWFSSALWPISTMGWPANGTSDKPEDQLLPVFYPTSVLSTARDILTLWVARMVMFGLYCRGNIPFEKVYVHPVIQDGEGRQMSKSKGNGVDPVEIINSHGADALRFTLAQMTTETQDIRMPVQLICPHCAERFPNPASSAEKMNCPKCKKPITRSLGTATGTAEAPLARTTSDRFDLGRNFANKIWNASRFILTNVEFSPGPGAGYEPTRLEDRWIISRLNATIAAAESAIDGFHFAEMATALYQFFWTDLCDWYLEISKARMKAGDAQVQAILIHCLETSLKLLHPVMPFISEAIWSKLPDRKSMLVTAPWPKPISLPSHPGPTATTVQFSYADSAAEEQIALVQLLTSAIRDLHNTYPAAKGKEVVIRTASPTLQTLIEASRSIIEPLAGVTLAEVSPTAAKPANSAVKVLPDAEIYIGGVVDPQAEIKKLTKRKDELQKLIPGNKAKLDNPGFMAKAPEKIVQGLRETLAAYEAELAMIEKNLAELSA